MKKTGKALGCKTYTFKVDVWEGMDPIDGKAQKKYNESLQNVHTSIKEENNTYKKKKETKIRQKCQLAFGTRNEKFKNKQAFPDDEEGDDAKTIIRTDLFLDATTALKQPQYSYLPEGAFQFESKLQAKPKKEITVHKESRIQSAIALKGEAVAQEEENNNKKTIERPQSSYIPKMPSFTKKPKNQPPKIAGSLKYFVENSDKLATSKKKRPQTASSKNVTQSRLTDTDKNNENQEEIDEVNNEDEFVGNRDNNLNSDKNENPDNLDDGYNTNNVDNENGESNNNGQEGLSFSEDEEVFIDNNHDYDDKNEEILEEHHESEFEDASNENEKNNDNENNNGFDFQIEANEVRGDQSFAPRSKQLKEQSDNNKTEIATKIIDQDAVKPSSIESKISAIKSVNSKSVKTSIAPTNKEKIKDNLPLTKKLNNQGKSRLGQEKQSEDKNVSLQPLLDEAQEMVAAAKSRSAPQKPISGPKTKKVDTFETNTEVLIKISEDLKKMEQSSNALRAKVAQARSPAKKFEAAPLSENIKMLLEKRQLLNNQVRASQNQLNSLLSLYNFK